MANLVMGAMSSIIPKLYQLLEQEYKLQTGVKKRISSLTEELESAQAVLRKVAQVPWDQLDEQVQMWARQVREASYDMEDILDSFLVRVQGSDSAEQEKSLLKPLKKMAKLFKKTKARRKISGDVKDIMSHLQEVTERCRRYKVEDIGTRTATTSTIDPRLHAMYTQVKNLVGMDKSSGELMSMLQTNLQQGDVSSMKMKIVSIVGVGGLGKTTLAKAVYDKIKGDFSCVAFVPVGRNPDLKKIFKDILIDLDKKRYLQYSTAALDERQLIDELREFLLENKRYLIIIDDIWEVESWETIKLAIDDDNDFGGRIIITTRKLEVATKADEVYELRPLPYDSSRELFIRRISGQEGKYIHNQPDEILHKFIRKCSGIPLAIITMASLLAGKQREEWPELYNTIDFGSKDNKEAETTMRILSFSYFDLPSHLRTCLLYLSAFPEDSFIDKVSLVWMWVAEGFVQKKDGMRLFEIGEGYFNDLINRSMIQQGEESNNRNGTITFGCRVHDVVLDFIRFMSQEDFFFTVLDTDQCTPLQQSNIVRRLANHNRTIGHTHQANHIEMPKLRSFIALRCVIETWPSLSSFTLLRVLAVENCNPRKGGCIQVEGLRYLPHLRFISLCRTRINRFTEDIGALRFLQTLDLWRSPISELPSSGSLPKQLACLRITLEGGDHFDGKFFSVEGMTSLEELTIEVTWGNLHFGSTVTTVGWLVNGLGCLGELRVLNIFGISWDDEEGKRDFVESLCHLHKLQSLEINCDILNGPPTWQATDLVLRRHLRHLAVYDIYFSKLPSCIDPSRVPKLSHLDLWLRHLDEQDQKILGGLPELNYLSLNLPLPELHYLSLNLRLWSPVTIDIIDSDACYFPKLRCFRLKRAIFSFLTNRDDKTVSFHIWNGYDTTSMPSGSGDESTQYVSDDELEIALFNQLWQVRPPVSDPSVSDDELERARPSVSHDENKGSTSCNGAAAAPRFMPSLQVLHLDICDLHHIPNWLDNPGWEHLSSLREINVRVDAYALFKDIWLEELYCAAKLHPNHPTLNVEKRY